MKSTFKAIAVTLLLVCSSHTQAAEKIEASSMTNPAPIEAFSAFDRFELAKVTMSAPYEGQKGNEHAQASFQLNLDGHIQEWLGQKNTAAARTQTPRVLLIEPRIEKVKFVTGGARFWAGAMAGSSRILVKVKFTDKESGKVIAEPEFYQHAAGMAGAYSMGGADNAMLERVGKLAAEYIKSNYDSAVGGPTGKPK